jgi:thiamine-phosphate pyrophosphorylase
VQLREKEQPERRLVDLGRRVREWTREANALFIMNDRADLAVVTDADGVHVGQDELSVKEARRIVGPRRLVGVSTHTIEQARQAVLDGADYIGVGPVFPSSTKAFESLAGLEFVREVAAEISLPWFAIGGINAENVNIVVEAGAKRIAVSNAILGAKDPEMAARELGTKVSSGE